MVKPSKTMLMPSPDVVVEVFNSPGIANVFTVVQVVELEELCKNRLVKLPCVPKYSQSRMVTTSRGRPIVNLVLILAQAVVSLVWCVQKAHCFYERFINEEELVSIGDGKIQRRFWVYFFSIAVFSGCSVVLPTFAGYSFENAFFITMFCGFLRMLTHRNG